MTIYRSIPIFLKGLLKFAHIIKESKTEIMKSIAYLLLFGLFFVACQGGESDTSTDTKEETTTETPTMAKKYTLTPFSPSPEFADAAMTKMAYTNNAWDFDIAGDSYELGVQTPDAPQKMCANSGKGQHIHLIIDNAPYNAKYTAEFDDVEVADGEHYILAFLSRSYHESIKTAAAHKAEKVSVANKAIESSEPVTTPMLFYSRPKGTYQGKANTDKVMLDFYTIAADLGAGQFQVKADINGEEHMIDKWQPYYIEGLPMGENTITLTLLDADGNKVEAPLNPVTRKFTLKADELEQ